MEEEKVVNNSSTNNDSVIVQTDIGAKDGQIKCPKCGSTDISTNTNVGKLRCNFCRHEFEPEKIEGMVTDVNQLNGKVMGSGAQDIVADTNDVLTFKCSSCGAEVVIDTASASQARCHWCRNTLSVNQQIPNGSIPDTILPFKVSKDEAKSKIAQFVGKRKFYAHPKFKKEFSTENIIGVYFPYMIVDINAHAKFTGQGEHLIRSYNVGDRDHQDIRYDADLYDVEREFDIAIDDLTVESSKDKLSRVEDKTNNIINSIMPFDTENCVKYDANFIKGYNSEKRDTNIGDLHNLVEGQSKDVAKFSINNTLTTYNRGVRWDNQVFDIKGEQWISAYLPVWLYSYREVKGKKSLLHYVAVNARTKETMGSVPIHQPKLLFISTIIEIIGIILFFIFMDVSSSSDDTDFSVLFLFMGVAYYIIIYSKYRNHGARHNFETETKQEVSNLRKVDNFVKHEKGLSNASINGSNNKIVSSSNSFSKLDQDMGDKFLKSMTNNNQVVDIIKNSFNKK